MAQRQLNWEHVDNSNVARVAHDDETKTLAVEFYGGGFYSYSGVTDDHYHGLLGAESVGKYLNSVIKVFYPFARFSDEDELVKSLAH